MLITRLTHSLQFQLLVLSDDLLHERVVEGPLDFVHRPLGPVMLEVHLLLELPRILAVQRYSPRRVFSIPLIVLCLALTFRVLLPHHRLFVVVPALLFLPSGALFNLLLK